MKILYAVAALLLLAGCRATFWAQPPSPQGGCDPAAEGSWYSEVTYEEEGPGQQYEVAIDAGCQVRLYRIVGGVLSKTSEPAMVRMGRIQDSTYAWIDANTLLAFNDNAHRTRAGDVLVVRYRIEGNQLRIWVPDHLHVRGLIASGALAGEFLDTELDEFNRLTGPSAPALAQLATPRFFDPSEIVLTRVGAEP